MALCQCACVCVCMHCSLYGELMRPHAHVCTSTLLPQASHTRYASRWAWLFKSPCNLTHNVFGLCHSSLIYLYPWLLCAGGMEWFTISVYYNVRAYYGLTKMIGGGWEEGVIQCVAPAGWTQYTWSCLIKHSGPGHLPPLACPLTSLSLVATLADTYLIGWLHVWTLRKQSHWLTTNDTHVIGQHCVCSADDRLTFCLTCRCNSLLASLFLRCVSRWSC